MTRHSNAAERLRRQRTSCLIRTPGCKPLAKISCLDVRRFHRLVFRLVSPTTIPSSYPALPHPLPRRSTQPNQATRTPETRHQSVPYRTQLPHVPHETHQIIPCTSHHRRFRVKRHDPTRPSQMTIYAFDGEQSTTWTSFGLFEESGGIGRWCNVPDMKLAVD